MKASGELQGIALAEKNKVYAENILEAEQFYQAEYNRLKNMGKDEGYAASAALNELGQKSSDMGALERETDSSGKEVTKAQRMEVRAFEQLHRARGQLVSLESKKEDHCAWDSTSKIFCSSAKEILQSFQSQFEKMLAVSRQKVSE